MRYYRPFRANCQAFFENTLTFLEISSIIGLHRDLLRGIGKDLQRSRVCLNRGCALSLWCIVMKRKRSHAHDKEFIYSSAFQFRYIALDELVRVCDYIRDPVGVLHNLLTPGW